MSSEIVVPFIIYLALFRLGIIAAGIVSIVLGYRLFCRGVWPERDGNGATLDVKIAEQSFTLKNAAPGTFFALFGVIIISVMFANSPPELSQTFLEPQSKGALPSLRLRGNDEAAVSKPMDDDFMEQLRVAARVYRTRRDFEGAERIYKDLDIRLQTSIDQVALLYNEWALVHLAEERASDAVEKAQVAIALRPQDDDYIDTLVHAICTAENAGAALKRLSELAGGNSAIHNELRESLEAGRCNND